MPTPDDREQLYRIDRIIRASGMAPLSPQELQQLYQQMQSQGVTNPMAMFGEAGLINDSSGEGTQRVRNQLGIR